MTNGTSNPPRTTSVPPVMPLGSVTAVTTGTLIMDTYEIEKLINSGGMGEVYRGRNIHNGEPVAIKIVLPALAHDPKIVALFQKESTVLSRLSHDAIVRYHTFTIDRSIGRPCMVMEFVSGTPLGERVEQGPMPLDEVKVMFRRVAGGLDKAHRAGVVHRDLSPDNVILEEGSVDHAKLIDFGIAKSASFGGGTLLGGQFAGKFNWVAPEQLGAFGGLVDGRSDIYSLALLVAAASRGKVIQMGDSIVDAVGKRASVPDLTGVDPELLPLLRYMLQPDPAQRPATMAAVIAALDNPALIPVVEAATPDPNRTVIGGALPVIPTSLPPQSLGTSPPPPAPMPVTGTGDWSVPSNSQVTSGPATSRPGTASPATVIAPQMTQAPLPQGAAVEAEDISPFGAPAAPGKASTPVVPPSPVAAPKKGNSGLLAVVGLVVVLGGAGAAWFGGLFGTEPVPSDGPAVQQTDADAQAALAAEKAAAEKAAADQAEADKIAAEKAASEKAAADQAAAEKAAADQAAAEKAAADQAAAEAKRQAEAERLAAEEAARIKAEADAQMTEEQAAAQRKAEEDAARQAAEAEAARLEQEQEAARLAAEAQARAEADAAAAAKAAEDEAARQAAANSADPQAAHLAWLAGVAMPECTHLRAAAGADPLTIDGFATSTAPLETLARAYTTDLKREPDVAPKLINEAQCPVLDFANRRTSADVPALTVRRTEEGDAVKSGGKINIVVEGINGRPFSAFLFSDGGGVTNLQPFAKQAPDGTTSFTFTLKMAAGAPARPQVVLVMATDAPLKLLTSVPNGVSAKSLMPYIEVALKDNTGPTALGLGFFRLEN